MPLDIVRNDISLMKVDVIVNSANPKPIIGAGVDSRIHEVAGSELLKSRQDIGEIVCGEAVITSGYNLHAKYVIHTVGPKCTDTNVTKLLENCYYKSLLLAVEYKCESIAFPLISTGNYGVSKSKALQIAIQTIHSFLLEHELQVYLVVYDKESYQLSEHLYKDIQSYIDDNYVEDFYISPQSRNVDIRFESSCVKSQRKFFQETKRKDAEIFYKDEYEECETESPFLLESLENIVNKVDESFSDYLFRLIDKKGMKDPEVYKKANIDRRHFSKIRSNKHYQPSKLTVIALSFALELNEDEMSDLLRKAGYALTHSSKLDIIVEYFIKNHNYNIFELNEVLFAFDLPTIGG